MVKLKKIENIRYFSPTRRTLRGDMEKTIENLFELVVQARSKDTEALNRLAEVAKDRLTVDVYRWCLSFEDTEEVVQESLIEIARRIGDLKEAKRFWSWSYRIAGNKLKLHWRKRKKEVGIMSLSENDEIINKNETGPVEKAIAEELQDSVRAAMRQLKYRQRMVLTLRCYRDMSFSQIGDSLGCSEFAAKMLFSRAKRRLGKELSRNGFGKGAMITALVLFGKITAGSEAQAAGISITAATMEAGAAAGIASIVGIKAAVVTAAAAGIITVGSLVVPDGSNGWTPIANDNDLVVNNSVIDNKQDTAPQQRRYFYPEGIGGPVMMQIAVGSADKTQSCQYLNNGKENYSAAGGNIVSLRNANFHEKDYSVHRLPGDSEELLQFLADTEGIAYVPDRIAGNITNTRGLLATTSLGGERERTTEFTHHANALDELYFQYSWADTQVLDQRDAMHKRGWTYFEIQGQINGKQLSGKGRLPFVYATYNTDRPWLNISIGNESFTDSNTGMLFKGLSRPWQGLHTIDTIRRDAAKLRLPFETAISEDGTIATVTVDGGDVTMVYTIDMENDLAKKINLSGAITGQVIFSYLQNIDEKTSDFVKPRSNDLPDGQTNGMMWLVEFAK